jgi:impB/mucB/samB family C-terminal domain
VTLDAAAATVGHFVLGQRGKEASCRPAFLVGLRGELGPHCFDGGQAQLGEQELDAGGVDGIGDMRTELGPLVDKVWAYCETTGMRARTVTLKVKFADFQIITRNRSSVAPISDRSMVASISAELLAAQFPMPKRVRLIGVSLSSLCADSADDDPQMALAF